VAGYGMRIEIGDAASSPRYFDKLRSLWTEQVIDFGASERRTLYGVPVNVIPCTSSSPIRPRSGALWTFKTSTNCLPSNRLPALTYTNQGNDILDAPRFDGRVFGYGRWRAEG
jgi:hypothetical protein